MNLFDKLTDVAREGHYRYIVDTPSTETINTLKSLGYEVIQLSQTQTHIKWGRASETRRRNGKLVHVPLPKVAGIPNALDLRQIARFMRRPFRI